MSLLLESQTQQHAMAVVFDSSLDDGYPPPVLISCRQSVVMSTTATTPHDAAGVALGAPQSPVVTTTAAAPIATLPREVFGGLIARFCDETSLLALRAAARWMAATLNGFDLLLWRPRCTQLWAGKVGGFDRLRVFAAAYRTPQELVAFLAGNDDAAGLLWSRRQSALEGATWQKLYYAALRVGHAGRITTDDLRASTWHVNFAAAGAVSQAATFTPGLTAASLTMNIYSSTDTAFSAGTPPMQSLASQVSKGGTELQVHVFPTLTVSRRAEDWGWRLRSFYVQMEALSLEERQQATLASRSSSSTQVQVSARVEAEVAMRLLWRHLLLVLPQRP